jgi:heme-binding protein
MLKTLVLTALTAAVLTAGAPTAQAQPGCTASALSSALGQVASATGGWLSSHP